MKFTSLLDSLEQIQQPSLLQYFPFHLELPIVVVRVIHTCIPASEKQTIVYSSLTWLLNLFSCLYQFNNETTHLEIYPIDSTVFKIFYTMLYYLLYKHMPTF